VHPGPNAHRCIGNLVIQVTAKRLAQELEAMTGSPPYLIGLKITGSYQTRSGGATRACGARLGNGEDGTEGHFIGMRSLPIPMVLFYPKSFSR